MKKLLNTLVQKPKKMFVVDGLGALFSAFMLGIVLVQFHSFFGIPTQTLYILASVALVLASLDFYFYRSTKINPSKAIQTIAILNLLYLGLSLSLGIYHAKLISIYGWLYLVAEMLILLLLVGFELKLARKVQS